MLLTRSVERLIESANYYQKKKKKKNIGLDLFLVFTFIPRSKTIEIGFSTVEKSTAQPPKTASEAEPQEEDKEVESILFNQEAMPLKSNNPTPRNFDRQLSSPYAGKSTPSGYNPTSESLKVDSPAESKNRLSPFNRFRTSLVMGSNKDTFRKLSNTSTASEEVRGRIRTESETSTGKSTEKRRFFYRKSRTGPLPGDGDSSSVASTASNSTTNLGNSHLALSQEEVNHHTAASKALEPNPRFAVRAKSEFSPRTASSTEGVSATTAPSGGGDYDKSGYQGGSHPKDNLFMAAAKRWASYDKPNYQTPFTRDNWKRSHRKFNYSRFLNYTRETFV